ncbi:MAG TPA: translational GTPase TypA [Bacillota bacterium]|nr:translational GTPase TypA [Clostridiales bacterium]HOQ14029.1 translational GTPase TypA [Bacillota bacterium]
MIRNDLRNIAIIAHVDHGKTTLVDQMLRQSGIFHENQVVTERVMDSNDLERERGITILAKNTSVVYKGVKINIVDTPGHADFSGEVERILKMVNGVLLLVDAAEGPMPQTRFVLGRAMELGLPAIVVINKIDRPDARLDEVVDEVLELFLELDASSEQFDAPMIFCSGRAGIASLSPHEPGTDLKPLFDTILDYIPAPEGDPDAPFQMLISSIDYNDYVGRIGIGRIERGTMQVGAEAAIVNYHAPDAPIRKTNVVSLFEFVGLERKPIKSASVGDIVCFSGAADVTIGDTITSVSAPEPLEFVKISEPTIEMTFSVNDSPFAGREGKYVTSRQLRERLYKETLRDVSLRVRDGDTTDSFFVAGRGEMHLSILIETMRREGYELACSMPRVLYKEIDGVKCEPIERVYIDVPDSCSGVVIEKLGARRGEMVDMHVTGSRVKLEYLVPARGLFGYRNEFLTDTRGEGILNSIFDGYQPYKGDITLRYTGSLVASETGEATAYGLYNAQDRGALFIGVQTPVYEGMIVGECPKMENIAVNVCKKKHLSAMRSSGSAEEALRLTPPKILTLESAIEFIAEDELIEVTPKSIRLRKRILNTESRLKAEARARGK